MPDSLIGSYSIYGPDLCTKIDENINRIISEKRMFYLHITQFNIDGTYNIKFNILGTRENNFDDNFDASYNNIPQQWINHWLSKQAISMGAFIGAELNRLCEVDTGLSELACQMIDENHRQHHNTVDMITKSRIEVAGDQAQLAALQQQLTLQQKHIDLLQDTVLELQAALALVTKNQIAKADLAKVSSFALN